MSSNDVRFSKVPEGYAIVAPRMELTFIHEGDRWTHFLNLSCPAVRVGDLPGPAEVEALGGDPSREVSVGFKKIVRTIEGDTTRDDPARVVSPVYQNIQDHPDQKGVCILLTGQATPHYFSAVVTAHRDGPGSVIEVDIADRCRAPIEMLAATYLVGLGSIELIDADTERIVWGGGKLGRSRLEFSTSGVDDVGLAEAGPQATRVQARSRLVPTTHTQRLFYSWRWTPVGGLGV